MEENVPPHSPPEEEIFYFVYSKLSDAEDIFDWHYDGLYRASSLPKEIPYEIHNIPRRYGHYDNRLIQFIVFDRYIGLGEPDIPSKSE